MGSTTSNHGESGGTRAGKKGPRGLRHLGLDEKSFAKGQSYVSVMTDLDGARVLEVMDGKDQDAGRMLLATLPDEVVKRIEGVCMDMSGSYQAAVESELPGVAIVHDRFHISAHLNDGVAAVHREENVRLQKAGDARLKGTQRLFGFDPNHFNDDQAIRFGELRDAELKTSRAWALKEMFRRFWDYRYEGSARKFFKKWFGWASRCQLKPIIKVAKMIKNHFENVITYLRHPITNAVTEGLNSKIQSIKANARGFPLLPQLPYPHSLLLWKAGSLPTMNPEERIQNCEEGGSLSCD